MFFQKNKKMKLGICYSVFDGYELLESSILAIRDEVDYIVVGYQEISYHNQVANENIKKVLYDLKNKNLIDEIYLYTPSFKVFPSREERRKRRIGLALAKKQGCNYFATMDCDEFYELEAFKKAKEFILQNNIKSSVVPMKDYVKEPIYQIESIFYCPFIFKINLFSRLKKVKNFPIGVDGSRCVNTKANFYKFSENEILTHHMRYVRSNLEAKYTNRSNLVSFNQNQINCILNEITNYQYPNDFIDYERNKHPYKVTKVDNIFNIKI